MLCQTRFTLKVFNTRIALTIRTQGSYKWLKRFLKRNAMVIPPRLIYLKKSFDIEI